MTFTRIVTYALLLICCYDGKHISSISCRTFEFVILCVQATRETYKALGSTQVGGDY